MVLYSDHTYSQFALSDGNPQSKQTPTTTYSKPLSERDDSRPHLTYPNWEKRADDPYNYGSLSTRDVVEAHPRTTNRMCNKPEKEPVEGSSPAKLLSKSINKVQSTSLKTTDIFGTKSKVPFWNNPKRITNPLAPEYRLSSHEPQPAYQPKFLRDSMNVSDIQGTAPKVRSFNENPRETSTIGCADIQGTSIRSTTSRDHRRDTNMEVKDINIKGMHPASGRPTLLDVQTEKDQPQFRVEGSQVSKATRDRVDGTNSSLTTKDIHGARPKNPHDPFWRPLADGRQKTVFRDNMRTDDIRGAQPTNHGTCPTQAQAERKVEKKVSRPSTPAPSQEEALATFKSHLSAEQHTSGRPLWDKFRQIDREQCGKVNLKELTSAMKDCHINLTPQEAKAILSAFDSDKSGYMNYREFAKQAARHYPRPPIPTTPVKPSSAPVGTTRGSPKAAVNPRPATPLAGSSSRPCTPQTSQRPISAPVKDCPASYPSRPGTASTQHAASCSRPATPGKGGAVTFAADPPPSTTAPRKEQELSYSEATRTITGVPDSTAVHQYRQQIKPRPHSAMQLKSGGRRKFDKANVPGMSTGDMEWIPIGHQLSDGNYTKNWRCRQDVGPLHPTGVIYAPPEITRNPTFTNYVRDVDRPAQTGQAMWGHHVNAGNIPAAGKSRPKSAHPAVFRATPASKAEPVRAMGYSFRQRKQLEEDIRAIRTLT